jgi:hypothetical protein
VKMSWRRCNRPPGDETTAGYAALHPPYHSRPAIPGASLLSSLFARFIFPVWLSREFAWKMP